MFRWWRGELAGMLPQGFRRAVGVERDTLILRLASGCIDVELSQGGRVRPIATLPFDEDGAFGLSAATLATLSDSGTRRARVLLVIDNDHIIRRRFDLPKAAAHDIVGALSFEIERQTPFRGSEIYLDYRIGAGADDRLAVDATIVPRRIVDPVLGVLKAHGMAPEAVNYQNPHDDPEERDPLGRRLRVSGLAAPSKQTGGIAGKLLAAACLSAILAAGTLFYRLEQIDAELSKAVIAARDAASPSLALKSAAVDFSRVTEFIAREKAAIPAPLAVLSALTDLLPDDVWAVQVGIRGDEVTLEGRSAASSAKLIGLLEQGAIFKSVKFQAPVTRDATQRFERFNIELKLLNKTVTAEDQR